MINNRIGEQDSEKISKLVLDDDFFKNLDDFILSYQTGEKQKSILIEAATGLKKSALRYTESVLESLRDDEKISEGAYDSDERNNLQSERMFSDGMQRFSHKTLEIDFSVLGRIFKKWGVTLPWFNPQTNFIKEPQRAKLISLKYIISLALSYRKLMAKETKTKEEEQKLVKILEDFDVEDIERILQKFDKISKVYRDDFLQNLNIDDEIKVESTELNS